MAALSHLDVFVGPQTIEFPKRISTARKAGPSAFTLSPCHRVKALTRRQVSATRLPLHRVTFSCLAPSGFLPLTPSPSLPLLSVPSVLSVVRLFSVPLCLCGCLSSGRGVCRPRGGCVAGRLRGGPCRPGDDDRRRGDDDVRPGGDDVLRDGDQLLLEGDARRRDDHDVRLDDDGLLLEDDDDLLGDDGLLLDDDHLLLDDDDRSGATTAGRPRFCGEKRGAAGAGVGVVRGASGVVRGGWTGLGGCVGLHGRGAGRVRVWGVAGRGWCVGPALDAIRGDGSVYSTDVCFRQATGAMQIHRFHHISQYVRLLTPRLTQICGCGLVSRRFCDSPQGRARPCRVSSRPRVREWFASGAGR